MSECKVESDDFYRDREGWIHNGDMHFSKGCFVGFEGPGDLEGKIPMYGVEGVRKIETQTGPDRIAVSGYGGGEYAAMGEAGEVRLEMEISCEAIDFESQHGKQITCDNIPSMREMR